MLPGLWCVLGLALSNVFMTLAWYWHLKGMAGHAWYIAALASWGIAFFEYLVQVPANRIGHEVFTIAQLKILQEVITLAVFIPIAIFLFKERITWNYAAAAACMVGAVFFVMRDRPS